MKKMMRKIFSTLVSFVLLTTVLQTTGDEFFEGGLIPQASAHFTSPGILPTTCIVGGSAVLPFSIGSGIGVDSVFSFSSSTTLITAISPGSGTASTTPSSSGTITLASVGVTAVSITVACPGIPGATTLFSHFHTQTSPPEVPTFPGSVLITALAANDLPVITPPAYPDEVHNDTPGQLVSTFATCTDPDIADTITSITFAGDAVATGPLVGVNPASIPFDILNPDPGGGPATANFTIFCTSSAPVAGQPVSQVYSVDFTNAPLTVADTCLAVLVAGKPLAALLPDDILVPTPFTIDYTLTDPDDATATRLGAAPPTATTVAGLTLDIFPANPLAVGVAHTATYTISPGFIPGVLTETFTNHNIAATACQIGPGGRSGYRIRVSYGDQESTVDVGPNVSYLKGSGIKRRCREVGYDRNHEQVAATEYGDLKVDTAGFQGSPADLLEQPLLLL